MTRRADTDTTASVLGHARTKQYCCRTEAGLEIEVSTGAIFKMNLRRDVDRLAATVKLLPLWITDLNAATRNPARP